MQFVVLIEKTNTGYSAHVPDLPGCVAAASTLAETEELIQSAVDFHVEGMRQHGEHIPQPNSYVGYVEVNA